MPFSTYTNNKVAEAVAGKTTFTAPTTYVALSTTTPAAGGTGVTEPSGNGYARVSVPAANWTSATGGVVSNNTAVSFPTATGSQGTVTYAVAYDASTAGNMLWFQALPVSKTITANDTLSFAVGALTVTQS